VKKVKADRHQRVMEFLDIRTLRRLFKALSADLNDYNRPKTHALDSDIGDLKRTYINMRQYQRNRDGDPLMVPKSFAKRAEKQIKVNLSALCATRKFNEVINIGGPKTGTANYTKARYRGKPDVEFNVGHLWYRNVWHNLYQDDRMLSKDYIVLKAEEYRTNVQHVRLYEVATYGIAEKEMVHGWVGQTKLGKQHCVFRTDKKLAITAAQKLTIDAINEQLKGENHG
jgi:hypothetical protein